VTLPRNLKIFYATFDEDDWRVLFEERAAIMEYEGGLSRERAEACARGLY